MSRERIRVYARVRSSNAVTNICSHRSGEVKIERTTTRDIYVSMISSCSQNITPLRTKF